MNGCVNFDRMPPKRGKPFTETTSCRQFCYANALLTVLAHAEPDIFPAQQRRKAEVVAPLILSLLSSAIRDIRVGGSVPCDFSDLRRAICDKRRWPDAGPNKLIPILGVSYDAMELYIQLCHSFPVYWTAFFITERDMWSCKHCPNQAPSFGSPVSGFSLSISIPRQSGAVNLQRLLYQYLDGEDVPGVQREVLHSSIACSMRSQEGTATKTIQITRVPRLLLIKLIRERFEEPKVRTAVEVPRLLVVPNTGNPANVVFKFAACGMHVSNESNHGHWTAMGIHLPSQRGFLYDSTRVLEVDLGSPNICIPSARIAGDMSFALYQRDATEDALIDIEAQNADLVVNDPPTSATAQASMVSSTSVDGNSEVAAVTTAASQPSAEHALDILTSATAQASMVSSTPVDGNSEVAAVTTAASQPSAEHALGILTSATAQASMVSFTPVDGNSAAAQAKEMSPGTSPSSTVITCTPGATPAISLQSTLFDQSVRRFEHIASLPSSLNDERRRNLLLCSSAGLYSVGAFARMQYLCGVCMVGDVLNPTGGYITDNRRQAINHCISCLGKNERKHLKRKR